MVRSDTQSAFTLGTVNSMSRARVDHVSGHSGNPANEFADAFAGMGATRRESGTVGSRVSAEKPRYD